MQDMFEKILKINDKDKSKLIHVVFEEWHFFLESLSLSDGKDEFLGLLVNKWQSLDDFPMIEHTLWEGLSLGVTSEHTGETE